MLMPLSVLPFVLDSMSRSSSAPQAAAIPFLQCDAAGKFHLQPEALKLISSIRGKIAPVVVAGPYRTGPDMQQSREGGPCCGAIVALSLMR
jgi:hypothetical protein